MDHLFLYIETIAAIIPIIMNSKHCLEKYLYSTFWVCKIQFEMKQIEMMYIFT